MQAALKLTTRVLPGKRIEVTAPELTEGEDVEIIVLSSHESPGRGNTRTFDNVREFLDSLAPIERTPEEWAEIEREFREERDSWGD